MSKQRQKEKKKNKRKEVVKVRLSKRRSKIREEASVLKELEKMRHENREKLEPIRKGFSPKDARSESTSEETVTEKNNE